MVGSESVLEPGQHDSSVYAGGWKRSQKDLIAESTPTLYEHKTLMVLFGIHTIDFNVILDSPIRPVLNRDMYQGI